MQGLPIGATDHHFDGRQESVPSDIVVRFRAMVLPLELNGSGQRRGIWGRPGYAALWRQLL